MGDRVFHDYCKQCNNFKRLKSLSTAICCNCWYKEYYKKYPERRLIRNKRLKQYGKVAKILKWTRYLIGINRARKTGKKWNIDFDTYSDLIDSGCIYCFKSLDTYYGHSLDKLDSNGDYTKKNVVPCCGTCNIHKNSDWTFEEMCVVMDALLKYRKKRGIKWKKRRLPGRQRH